MTRFVILAAALLTLAGGSAVADVDPTAAFETLKELGGTWTGEGGMGEERGAITHEIRVSAAGSVVMETMNPGMPHEMINMFHMDGGELVMTHYCAAGNQPTLRLNAGASSPGELHFDFAGGTNLDPSADMHMHEAVLRVGEDGTYTGTWVPWMGGKAGPMNAEMVLRRAE